MHFPKGLILAIWKESFRKSAEYRLWRESICLGKRPEELDLSFLSVNHLQFYVEADKQAPPRRDKKAGEHHRNIYKFEV